MPLTILAIDDSSTMRRLVQSTLVQSGYAVEVAEDGIDGLEKLDDVRPDLVITDINMPRLDGFGVIEGVRKHPTFNKIPILTLTTESAAELKQRARTAGASGWIVKPFNKDKLLLAIKRVLG
jgi:two-component system chemotaxis response regulator CheY